MKPETAAQILQLVKKNYQQIAVEFDLSRRKMVWPILEEYCQKLPSGLNILDLGCGNGRLLTTLQDKPKTYLGIDNSPALIALAQANYPDNKFLVGDMLAEQTFSGEKYDRIFCLAALQHIPGKDLRIKALQLIKQALAVNGEAIISNWNIWQSKHRLKIFHSFLNKLLGKNNLDFGDIIFPWQNQVGVPGGERYYHAFTKRELRKLAQQAGFKNIRLLKDKHNFWLFLK